MFNTEGRATTRMDCRANSGKLLSATSLLANVSYLHVYSLSACLRPDLFFLHEEKFDFDVSMSPAR